MAEDLKDTPTAGLTVQLCGDAHLSNFGAFASPERALVFDLNDFDETLPGPFEYDVKRLAASFTIAARNNGFTKAEAKDAALASAQAYREGMAQFAEMRTLDIWYARFSEQELLAAIDAAGVDQGPRQALEERPEDGPQGPQPRQPAGAHEARRARRWPVPHRQPAASGRSRSGTSPSGTATPSTSSKPWSTTSSASTARPCPTTAARSSSASRSSTWPARSSASAAWGSGRSSSCSRAATTADPLFLQIKGANASVLEGHLPKSRYRQPGERVVQGQRLMQGASDIFLGWAEGAESGHHNYWRQLRDMKGSAVIEAMTPTALTLYARVCGETLARAHARSGDPVAIAAYLGSKPGFDTPITDFAKRYADQNDRDYEAFTTAISKGRLDAIEGI